MNNIFRCSSLIIILLIFVTKLYGADHNIKAFGAVSDTTVLSTKAIQSAIDACSTEGGTVVIPAGNWLSGTLILKSNVELHLSKGAVLYGSRKLEDYPEANMFGILPSYGFFIRHVNGIHLSNLRLTASQTDQRPALWLKDVKKATFDQIETENKNPGGIDILAEGCDGLFFNGCKSSQEASYLLKLIGNGNRNILLNQTRIEGKTKACDPGETLRKEISLLGRF